MRIYIILIALITSGCITPVKIDYASPQSGPTSEITITSVAGKVHRNMPVLVHTDKCDYESSKLAGLLYSVAVGVDYAEKVTFQAKANQKVSISVQAIIDESIFILPVPAGSVAMAFVTAKTQACRPIVDFYAKAGVNYKVELISNQNICSYDVLSNESGTWEKIKGAKIRENCTLPYFGGPKPTAAN